MCNHEMSEEEAIIIKDFIKSLSWTESRIIRSKHYPYPPKKFDMNKLLAILQDNDCCIEELQAESLENE